MKTKIIALVILMLTVLTGCKDEKTVEKLEDVKLEEIDNSFKVTLRVIVKKDDSFSLFYTEDGSIDFKTEPIWKELKGSNSEQKVSFSIPEPIFPTQLRLDLGLTNDQDDIVLKSVLLEYKGKKREFIGSEIGGYFIPDLTKCTFDVGTGIIKAVVQDGTRKSPSLYPQEKTLGPEILKLAK